MSTVILDESKLVISKELKGTKESMHGSLGDESWAAPVIVTEFDVEARPCFTKTKAHEYMDTPEVFQAKCKQLANLILKSKNCIAYTGAGISTAAGISDYATKAKEDSIVAADKPKVKNWFDARPTYSHRALVALWKTGMLKNWIQQNHDSLPQKAGLPQSAINEIHGSLHNPSNPIIPIEGTLRDDLFTWMREWANKTDLVLALGTSMSGMNSDQVPLLVANKAAKGKALGLVIVNLQQTQHDDKAALRIFGKIDDVMKIVAEELALEVTSMDAEYKMDTPKEAIVEEDVFLVPFDAEGKPSKTTTVWDLRIGKKVRLTGGPYENDIGEIVEKNQDGHYKIKFENSIHPVFKVKRRMFYLWLGTWWVESAVKGMGVCPVSNLIPLVSVQE